MHKKAFLIGFITGLVANSTGVILYILIFSGLEILETLITAYKEGFLSSLIALGAILNLIAFFWFLKHHKEYKARGVLAATILIALFLVFYKTFSQN